MDRETHESLQVAIDYLLTEEEKHYEEWDKPAGHIYEHALRLSKWADANRPTEV